MYEIKVLSNEDFDQVAQSDPRYSYVDGTNLGFADREKGVAYVRQTGVHDLNKYLISHELEELEHDESNHEDPNGIRHKKFFKEILAPVLNLASYAIPGIGPAVGAAGNFILPKFGATSGSDFLASGLSKLFGGGKESSVYSSGDQQQSG